VNCDGCTLCCFVLPVEGRSKKAYAACRDCELGVGCTRYDERPPECVAFDCSYRLATRCSDDLRPDNCGVVFEEVRGGIMLGTMVDEEPMARKEVRGQVRSFQHEGKSVVLHSGGRSRRHVFAAPDSSTERVMCSLTLLGVA